MPIFLPGCTLKAHVAAHSAAHVHAAAHSTVVQARVHVPAPHSTVVQASQYLNADDWWHHVSQNWFCGTPGHALALKYHLHPGQMHALNHGTPIHDVPHGPTDTKLATMAVADASMSLGSMVQPPVF
jgi:hypothetical protein